MSKLSKQRRRTIREVLPKAIYQSEALREERWEDYRWVHRRVIPRLRRAGYWGNSSGALGRFSLEEFLGETEGEPWGDEVKELWGEMATALEDQMALY